MANIATLAVALTARTGQFNKGISGASKNVSSFAGKIKNLGGLTFGVVGAAAGVGAAIAGVGVASAKSTADQILFARRLSATQAELSAVEFAGQKAGNSVENTRLATQRFTRRLQEAAAGGGELKDTLIELGLDAERLLKLPLPERLREFGKALFAGGAVGQSIFDIAGVTSVERLGAGVKGLTAEQQLARRAFKAFDSEGVGTINTLRELINAEERAEDAVKRLGLAIEKDQEDPIVRSIGAMKTALAPIRGLVTQLGVAFAPAIQSTADAIQNFASNLIEAAGGPRELAKSVANLIIGGFLILINVVSAAANSVFDFIEFSILGIGRLVEAVASLVDAFRNIGPAVREFAPITARLLQGAGVIGPGTARSDLAAGARTTTDALVEGFREARPTFDTSIIDKFATDLSRKLGFGTAPDFQSLLGEVMGAGDVVKEQQQTNQKLGEIIELSRTRGGVTTPVSTVGLFGD